MTIQNGIYISIGLVIYVEEKRAAEWLFHTNSPSSFFH